MVVISPLPSHSVPPPAPNSTSDHQSKGSSIEQETLFPSRTEFFLATALCPPLSPTRKFRGISQKFLPPLPPPPQQGLNDFKLRESARTVSTGGILPHPFAPPGNQRLTSEKKKIAPLPKPEMKASEMICCKVERACWNWVHRRNVATSLCAPRNSGTYIRTPPPPPPPPSPNPEMKASEMNWLQSRESAERGLHQKKICPPFSPPYPPHPKWRQQEWNGCKPRGSPGPWSAPEEYTPMLLQEFRGLHQKIIPPLHPSHLFWLVGYSPPVQQDWL